MTPVVDIPRHIVKAKGIGRITHHGSCVGTKKISLRPIDIEPGWENKILFAAACSRLPLRFRRKALAHPLCIGIRAIPSDADNRVLCKARFNDQLACVALNSSIAQTDDVVIVLVFFSPHRLQKADKLLVCHGMDIHCETRKPNCVARDFIASPFIAPADILASGDHNHLC